MNSFDGKKWFRRQSTGAKKTEEKIHKIKARLRRKRAFILL